MPSTSSAHDIISNSKGFVGNLMEWAPVFQLKAENIQLREDAHDLQAQIEELEQWKARALKHMTDMAPKRSKAQKDIQHAMELKKKLRAVEKTLHDRVQLEQEARVLQEKEMKLQQRVDQLEKEKKNLLIDSSHAKRQQQRAEAQLSMLEELFRLHLEKLVNIREHAEIGTVNWNKEAQEAITKHKLVHGSSSQTNNSTIFSPVSKDQSPFPPLPSSCISKDFENGSEYDDLKSQAINDSMMVSTTPLLLVTLD
jgi:cell division protein FtsB